jgi:mRNA interferase HigB
MQPAAFAVTCNAVWRPKRDKVLNRERVRFEVAGGNYRLVAALDLARQIAFVKFIGSHAESDRIDALTASQF